MSRGKAEARRGMSDQPLPSCRGIGDGMQTKGTRRNTGDPSGDRSTDQLVIGGGTTSTSSGKATKSRLVW
jgi:hypothetical protein